MIRHTAGFDITVKDKALYLNKKIRKHNQIILQEINFANNVLMCDCCTLYITFITANNVLYVYDPNNTTYSVDFTKIANNVTTVSCGYEHIAYVSNGELYVFGKNLIHMKISDNVTDVSSGKNHVAYISNGTLYSFNKISRVAYNVASTNSIDKISDNVTTVKCNESLIVYTAAGELYIFNKTHSSEEKTKIANNVIMFDCTKKNIYFVKSDNELYHFTYKFPLGENNINKLDENVAIIGCRDYHLHYIKNRQQYNYGETVLGELYKIHTTSFDRYLLIKQWSPNKHYLMPDDDHDCIKAILLSLRLFRTNIARFLVIKIIAIVFDKKTNYL